MNKADTVNYTKNRIRNIYQTFIGMRRLTLADPELNLSESEREALQHDAELAEKNYDEIDKLWTDDLISEFASFTDAEILYDILLNDGAGGKKE